MNVLPAISRREFERMTTSELRAAFLIERLFTAGQIDLSYWETDRTVIGSAVPLGTPLKLEVNHELAAECFWERRELGVMNIGGGGTVTVDGASHSLRSLDCLYVGRGSREVRFASENLAEPAKFYLVCYPAHAVHPTKVAKREDAKLRHLGDQNTANQRTISQMIHEGGLPSCQLVLGCTRLAPGSVWNTMPPHTHARRSEVYLYFDVADDAAVFHFMGPGEETRHLLVHSGQAVLSPAWSIHAGCGTSNYSFIWAMGGENQRFDDMDGIAISDLR